MNKGDLIKKAYEVISDKTPLKYDCGQLCDSACCTGKGYMLLFPGEKKLLEDKGFSFSTYLLKGYGQVDTLICEGVCEREFRPLSCRICPLAPKMIEGFLYVRLDSRGRSICPLTDNGLSAIGKGFIVAVKESLTQLCESPEIRRFIQALSDRIDEYETPLF